MKYLEAGAVISPCGKYRYVLIRGWEYARYPDEDTVVFLMLNPSTADGATDDATIRKCVAFAKRWGYLRLEVVNLFAFRATEPAELKKAADPVGPRNDEMILDVCCGRTVVCAWGSSLAKAKRRVLFERAGVVKNLLDDESVCLRHLGLNDGGHPAHPLYLKSDTEPQPF